MRKGRSRLQRNHPQKRRRKPSAHNTNPPRSPRLTRARPRLSRTSRRPTHTPTPRGIRIPINRLGQDTLHHLALLVVITLHLARQRGVPVRNGGEGLQALERGDAGGDAVLGGRGGEGDERSLDLCFLGDERGGGGGGQGGEFGGYGCGEGGGVGCELGRCQYI